VINEQIAVQELLGEVQNNSLLTAISCGQQIESLVNNFNTSDENVSEVAKNCFEGELGNDSELMAKKLATCGVIVADNEIPIEALDGMDAPQIAVVVDMGVTIAKVGYKLAQGKMQLTKAVEYIYDRSVAAIGVVTETVLKLQSQLVGTRVGAVIGSVLGPVETMVGAMGGAIVGRLAGNKIAQGIKTGIVKIGKFAKESVVKAVNKAKEAAQKVGKEVTKAATKVKEFLGNLFR
jgi:hypothetical protein